MSIGNVYRLGVKELISLARDPLLASLVVYAFSLGIYTAATSRPETVRAVAVAIVDEDQSRLSMRIVTALAESPYFLPPASIGRAAVDAAMDRGDYAFVLDIPPSFERDLLAGRRPSMLLSIDATRSMVAYVGGGYLQAIVAEELSELVQGHREAAALPIDLVTRMRFNPNLTRSWFGGVLALIDQITMLAIVLTGAALIREREHGTIEHLLVMPLTPAEIVLAKIWSMAAVVLVAATLSLEIVVRRLVGFPIEGSVPLFLFGAALHLFAVTSMGIFFGTVARSMPQLGLLIILVLMPLQALSGGMAPRESQPEVIRAIMSFAPTTHFVSLAQATLFRAGGLRVVWPQLAALSAIGAAFFAGGLWRFRKSIAA